MTAGYSAPVPGEGLMSQGEPLPGLSCSHAEMTPSDAGDNTGSKFSNLEFKSGASYEGGMDNGKKCGTGHFSWPNGAWFEGEYMSDMRQGKGTGAMWRIGLHCWVYLFLFFFFLIYHHLILSTQCVVAMLWSVSNLWSLPWAAVDDVVSCLFWLATLTCHTVRQSVLLHGCSLRY